MGDRGARTTVVRDRWSGEPLRKPATLRAWARGTQGFGARGPHREPAAPPAVRMTLPEANPTYYLTAALAITFPFNLLAGIPLYYQFSRLIAG